MKEPSQLAALDTTPDFFQDGWFIARDQAFTYAQLESLKRNQQAFSDILAFATTRFNLSTGG